MKTQIDRYVALFAIAAAGPLAAQTAPATPTAKPEEEEALKLTPFEVRTTKDTGYQATETLAGTRIRTDLKDVGAAISVITKEFLNDIGATDGGTLLQYTTNAEVAGTRGTYAGLGNGTGVDETGNLRAPANAQRVRGLASADNARDFFVTDIPWDTYNVDRVEIQRGPNSILFGLGSPAGMVNSTLRNAEFRNLGSVDTRFGSYGSKRGSLDINQQLIPKVLALRLDGLWNAEKFRQKPAFQDDQRLYGAVRFDPKIFDPSSFSTSIRVKYEDGDIKANRPRTTPPVDSISPWFRPVNNTSLFGGMGKLSVNNGYEIGANGAATNPWLTGGGIANQQQPIWFIDGTTNQLQRIYGGYVNTGARNVNGTDRGASGSLIGQRYADMFFGISSLSAFATNARLPNSQYGQYRNMSLQDASVFDFNNNLIDGQNKKEWENWNAYNVDITQTAFRDRVGVQLTYDHQKYKRGGEGLLGNPGINIDVLRNFQDLTANPNYGRPYVLGGPGGGNSYESDRKYARASIFGELRSRDFLKNDFFAKLLGRHRFNGVYADEKYQTENRSWRMYAHSREWAAYWNRTDGSSSDFKDRPPVSVIYLGSSLANANSASGANIPRILSPVTLQNGGVYHFDATWRNLPGVNFADPWTVPANLTTIFDPATAVNQVSNPANYVGWNSNFQDNLLRYNDGQDKSLTTIAQKSLRVTKSMAGSWQAFLWNDAFVATMGWRFDEVKSKSVSASPVTLNRQMLNLAPDAYRLPDVFPANQIVKDHSTSGGVVAHLNRILRKDPLPINISLSFNKSNNFQVTDTRRDVYGTPISNPAGKTKDYGILLSTKDGKYSFRAIRYESSASNAATPVDLDGLAGAITQGIKFRNVFLYRMAAYDWASREQTNLTAGQRYFWTPAYVTSTGRPVADLNGAPTPIPAGATLQTQGQADAHRDASIRAWNDIQRYLDGRGFFRAWGYTPTTLAALTDRATYEATLNGGTTPAAQYMPDISSLANYAAIRPQGLTVTADTESKGYEFELVANPLPNWRLTFNAAQTEAVRNNVGGALLDELVAYMDTAMAGVAGDMRQFNGNYVASNEVRQNWANWRGQYTLLKLQAGSAAPELRKWRYNFVTNYSFREGRLKGLGLGGSYRWQDKVVIGYPVVTGTGPGANFDLTRPFHGPSENAVDLWTNYERKVTDKITWKVQLNVRNAFAKDGLIPISVQPDGQTWAAVRVKPAREWFITNTFSF